MLEESSRTEIKIGYAIKFKYTSQTQSDITTAKDLGSTENASDLQYAKDMEKAEQTTWTVNNHRTASTVNKTMQLIQKSLKYGWGDIRNKTHKE